jgi:O-antigen ligase
MGVLLFGAAAAWATIAAAAAGTAPGPMVVSILVTGLALGVSWAVAVRWPTPALAALVVGALLLVAADPASVVGSDATHGPLGYANASAALYGVAAIAALLLALQVRTPLALAMAALAGVLFVWIIILLGSSAVVLLVPAVVVAAIVATRIRGARAAVVVCGLVFVGALVATHIVGATQIGIGNGVADRTIRGALSIDRVLLWHEAIEITALEPFLGVGPGNFASSSSIARSDSDLQWAHHEFLQAGAEMGIPGYVLVVALFAWGFAALWMTANGMLTAIAAAGLAIVGVHATIDYILHFPAVPLAIAVVVGTVIGGSVGPGRDASSLREVAP